MLRTRRRSRSRQVAACACVVALLGLALASTQADAAGGNPTLGTSLQAPKLPGLHGKWDLTMDSEFTGTHLDRDLWTPGWFGWHMSGPINDETERACYSSHNVWLPGNGSAILSLRATPSHCHHRLTEPYTGAILSSNPRDGRRSGGFQFRYGLIEARVYVPAHGNQIGDWPAVEMLGQHWPNDGEDDIFEVINGQACYRLHSLANVNIGFGDCLNGLRPGWNTVAANWQPRTVTYYYNGRKVGRVTRGVTHSPMYVVIVNTLSAKYPNVWQQDGMRVDYVRVWQNPLPGRRPATVPLAN